MLQNPVQILAALALILAVVGLVFPRYPLVSVAVMLLALAVYLGTTG